MTGRIVTAMVVFVFASVAARAEPGQVWKTPSCACCAAWIDHMAQNGYDLKVTEMAQGALSRLKNQSGIPATATSCHTAKIGGYVIEGHVPASDVKRLLEEKPDAAGLAAPGMPAGAPGMETGDVREAFNVLLIKKDGSTEVFARHGAR